MVQRGRRAGRRAGREAERLSEGHIAIGSAVGMTRKTVEAVRFRFMNRCRGQPDSDPMPFLSLDGWAVSSHIRSQKRGP